MYTLCYNPDNLDLRMNFNSLDASKYAQEASFGP